MQTSILKQENTVNRIIVLNKIIDRKITQKEAGGILNLSDRQIRRLLIRFKEKGPDGLQRKTVKTKKVFQDEFRQKCISLIKEHYCDFGPSLASEKLLEQHHIKVSNETLRKWMIDCGLYKARKRKKAHIHPLRERRPCVGELVQIDGSHHDWFEGRSPKCCLLLMIDDATSKILAARFEMTETTIGYMRCCKQHLQRHGKPVAYYSDKHSIFKINNKQKLDFTESQTQFQRALKQLGIALKHASTSQAKGRVERANKTLQDRLVKEMRLRGINTIDEGNAFLDDMFIKFYNNRFGVMPANDQDMHINCTLSDECLDLILSIQEPRKLDKNLQLSFEGVIYKIKNAGAGHRLRQATVMAHQLINGSIVLVSNGITLEYEKYYKQDAIKTFDEKTINQEIDRIIEIKKLNTKNSFFQDILQ